jgi:23S rRNA-/tRNA-specific pseudouridylate synthase
MTRVTPAASENECFGDHNRFVSAASLHRWSCMLSRAAQSTAKRMSDISSKRARLSASLALAEGCDAQVSSVVDDPCWGSPKECSLPHLLRQLDRSKTIIYESDDFLVLNKPPDLRMDGEYPATVHKLLSFWFPSRALLDKCDTSSPLSQAQSLQLQIATIHQHDNQDPDCLRPCHQLDYATSGVLLVARNKTSANIARLAFEHRLVEKTYTALVHGHVKTQSDWPLITKEKLQSTMEKLESYYRSTRAKRHKDTWNGFQPPHAIFQQWQMQRKLDKQRRHSNKLNAEEWEKVWNELGLTDDEARLLEIMKWDKVKAAKMTCHFKRATNVYNSIAKSKEEKTTFHGSLLPTLFRVQEDMSESIFYIFAPLAQTKDDFAMRIHKDQQLHSAGSNLLCASDIGATDSLDFKPSLTQCRLEQDAVGHLSSTGGPVTRVSLCPLTGRRHQLRVHMALLGHAIVGDQTYQTTAYPNDEKLIDRMCLHSSSLEIPVQADGTLLKVKAEAPFQMIKGYVSMSII